MIFKVTTSGGYTGANQEFDFECLIEALEFALDCNMLEDGEFYAVELPKIMFN